MNCATWMKFVAWQGVLLSLGATWAWQRHASTSQESQPPRLRQVARQIAPKHDRPEIITDEQLSGLLQILSPPFSAGQLKVNHVEHALRFWGLRATFEEAEGISGAQMHRLLTDHERFKKSWNDDTPPLWTINAQGWQARVEEGAASAAHVDHTLAVLVEAGTPTNFPVRTTLGVVPFRSLVEGSLRNFSLQQPESEWSVLSYALLLEPTDGWRTSEGQWITWGDLAERLMQNPLGQGACFGLHRLYTLAIMLRVDEGEPVLTEQTRSQIRAHLLLATQTLVASQDMSGAWGSRWPTAGDQSVTSTSLNAQSERILATGHILEWWALAPEELHPPRETLVRAGQWLCRAVGEQSPDQIATNYAFLTHAGRSLALWRGRYWPQ